MGKCCSTCRYWQGRTTWGDCYRVVAELVPELEVCEDNFNNKFKVPFDPTDAKIYYSNNLYFHKLYKQARSCVPMGVRVVKYHGLYFFMTHGLFSCGRYMCI